MGLACGGSLAHTTPLPPGFLVKLLTTPSSKHCEPLAKAARQGQRWLGGGMRRAGVPPDGHSRFGTRSSGSGPCSASPPRVIKRMNYYLPTFICMSLHLCLVTAAFDSTAAFRDQAGLLPQGRLIKVEKYFTPCLCPDT